MILSKRSFLKYKFEEIEKFVGRFKIDDFNKKEKVKKYFDFFNFKNFLSTIKSKTIN